MAHRFYIQAELISGNLVSFTADQRKQIKNVLRLKPGDLVTVFDGSGREFKTKLNSEENGRIIDVAEPNTESRLRLTLVQSLPKGDKIELILQKCTEIGAAEFIIMVTSRSIPRIEKARLEGRIHRWRSIVIEAAEQCGRVRIPEIYGIVSFREALSRTADVEVRVMAWESEKERRLPRANETQSMALFIGPEGGFSQEEVAEAAESGVIPVSLGPRILRTETAAIVGSALAIYGCESEHK